MSASLETPRLRLRRLIPADEADLIALDSDPDVMRHVGSPAGVKSPEETAEQVKRRVLDSGRGDHDGLGFWRVEGRADDLARPHARGVARGSMTSYTPVGRL